MATVYVLNKDGNPLMPTTRCGRVRRLLKAKQARVVSSKPFTIQLLYEVENAVQDLGKEECASTKSITPPECMHSDEACKRVHHGTFSYKPD